MIDQNIINDIFVRDDAGALMHLSSHDTDINGRTLLHQAAHFGAMQCVRLLLGAGAPVDQADVMGETPLHRACYSGSVDVIALLLRQKPNLSAQTFFGATALHYAARKHQNAPTMIRDLLHAGADPALTDQRGLTPKDWAQEHGVAWPVGV